MEFPNFNSRSMGETRENDAYEEELLDYDEEEEKVPDSAVTKANGEAAKKLREDVCWVFIWKSWYVIWRQFICCSVFHASVGPGCAPSYSVVNAIIEKKEDGPGPRDLQKATQNFTTLIGQGAFAPVYKAQMSTGEIVAVKVLATD